MKMKIDGFGHFTHDEFTADTITAYILKNGYFEAEVQTDDETVYQSIEFKITPNEQFTVISGAYKMYEKSFGTLIDAIPYIKSIIQTLQEEA